MGLSSIVMRAFSLAIGPRGQVFWTRNRRTPHRKSAKSVNSGRAMAARNTLRGIEKMKNVVIAATLACALIGVGQAEAKTKVHHRAVQMVETAGASPPNREMAVTTQAFTLSRWSRRSVSWSPTDCSLRLGS